MPHTLPTAHIAIGNALKLLLPAGVPLVAENQDTPRPAADTFASFLVMADTPMGQPSVTQTDVPEMAGDPPVPTGRYMMISVQTRTCQVQVQTYGPNAANVMAGIVALYEHPLVVYNITQLGVSLQAVSEVTRIPASLLSETEDRWLVTITAGYLRTDSLAAPTVDTPSQVIATAN